MTRVGGGVVREVTRVGGGAGDGEERRRGLKGVTYRAPSRDPVFGAQEKTVLGES